MLVVVRKTSAIFSVAIQNYPKVQKNSIKNPQVFFKKIVKI